MCTRKLKRKEEIFTYDLTWHKRFGNELLKQLAGQGIKVDLPRHVGEIHEVVNRRTLVGRIQEKACEGTAGAGLRGGPPPEPDQVHAAVKAR